MQRAFKNRKRCGLQPVLFACLLNKLENIFLRVLRKQIGGITLLKRIRETRFVWIDRSFLLKFIHFDRSELE